MKYIIEFLKLTLAYCFFYLIFIIPYFIWYFRKHPELDWMNRNYKRKVKNIFNPNRPQIF